MSAASSVWLCCAAAAALAVAAAQPSEGLKYKVLDSAPESKARGAHYQVANRDRATVVAIYAGQKPTGGYEVKVTGAERRGKICVVKYRVEAPPRDAIVTQVLTYPSVAVRIEANCAQVDVEPPLPQAKTRE